MSGSSVWGHGYHFGEAAGYARGLAEGVARAGKALEDGLAAARSAGIAEGYRSGMTRGVAYGVGGVLLAASVVEGGRRGYLWWQRRQVQAELDEIDSGAVVGSRSEQAGHDS